jgi:hypothetical protein
MASRGYRCFERHVLSDQTKLKTMLKSASSKIFLTASSLLFIAVLPINGESGKRPGTLLKENNSPVNRRVTRFVKTYISANKRTLYKIRRRSSAPFVVIDSVLNHYHLPAQLKYMAVIESELKTTAVSRVGAVGPWQLMPMTARDLGLKTTPDNDERKIFSKSTRAAARYIKDLYAAYGDWLLVLAAYNGGPGPVNMAMHRAKTRDFWTLQHYLPAETREYVNKFIATWYYFERPGSIAKLSWMDHSMEVTSCKSGRTVALVNQ